jgi:ribonuclease HI
MCGGWATVILREEIPTENSKKSHTTKKIYGGEFKTSMGASVNAAELAAAANGLKAAWNNGLIYKNDQVSLVSDSEVVIRHVGELTPYRKIDQNFFGAAMLNIIQKIMIESGMRLRVHKIKAHTKHHEALPNSWIALNNVVDVKSREHMRQAREKMKRMIEESEKEKNVLIITARSNDPVACLISLWNLGHMEARHVKSRLEKLVAEEREKNPEAHIRACISAGLIPRDILNDPLKINRYVASELSKEEVVQASWFNDKTIDRLLRANINGQIVAEPNKLISALNYIESLALNRSYSSIQFLDTVLELEKKQTEHALIDHEVVTMLT